MRPPSKRGERKEGYAPTTPSALKVRGWTGSEYERWNDLVRK
ncbi:hypothetical protein OP10G_0208 [Fimbriimonas ginsengisoli Gsoil 348]|uniref:Uncharacterized protein n=1 Tax=Fimbriimonas ginsengisoli Gsoil 348 TaxID=661478 RepID=A0A068NJB8_FIMGI|nr:hypothetical protein OP10G_0208 [Fimbriimonas ginsengisoli Gsoil 348]